MASTVELLEVVGSHGRWQLLLFLITSFSGFFFAFHHLSSVFIAATPSHWCNVPYVRDAEPSNANNSLWTDRQIRDYAIPKESTEKFDSCRMYARNYSAIHWLSYNASIDGRSLEELQIVPCDTWIYNITSSKSASTVVTEWDLVCDKAALSSVVQAIYMLGIFFGTFTYGFISDRFGRRRAILIAATEFVCAGLLASIPINYVWFITCRWLTGMGAGGVFSVCFVLMAEFTGPTIRDVLGIAYQVPFSFGAMSLPIFAYFIQQWNSLQLAISLLGILLVSYYFIIPESPRWLIMNNRFEEAVTILQKVARINGIKGVDSKSLAEMMEKCKDDESISITNTDVPKTSSGIGILLDLYRTPQMRKRILVSYFTWASASMCYYGLSLKAPTLGHNRYLVSFLAALVEVPSYAIGCVIIRYLPRKVNFCGTFLAGGVSCLLILIVSSSVPWVTTALALTGKFFISISYSIVYLYTTEMFPTQNRNIALGTSSMCARIGATSAPFIVDLLGRNLPLLIFGVASILAGLLTVLLPETRNRSLPDTIEDVEGLKADREIMS